MPNSEKCAILRIKECNRSKSSPSAVAIKDSGAITSKQSCVVSVTFKLTNDDSSPVAAELLKINASTRIEAIVKNARNTQTVILFFPVSAPFIITLYKKFCLRSILFASLFARASFLSAEFSLFPENRTETVPPSRV